MCWSRGLKRTAVNKQSAESNKMKLFIPSFYTSLLQIVVYWYRQELNSKSIIHPSEALLIKLIRTDNYLID